MAALAASLGLTQSGCGPVDPIFPLEPAIEFVSVSPGTVFEFGAFDVKIRYQDGDGDLGYTAPDSSTFDLVLRDQREGLPVERRIGEEIRVYDGILRFQLPYLTPEARQPSIQGEITITVEGVILLDPFAESEELVFDVQIYDRAGNGSNVVQTSPVTILPSF